MPVRIQINDGPAAAPWASQDIQIRAGSTAQGAALDPYNIPGGTTASAWVTVRNLGTDPTNECNCSTTGPFVPGRILEPTTGFEVGAAPLLTQLNQGTSPDGSVSIAVQNHPLTGKPETLTLNGANGQPILTFTFPSGPTNATGWGFSADSHFLVMLTRDNASTSPMGQFSIQIAKRTNGVWAQYGLNLAQVLGYMACGFSPNSKVFAYLTPGGISLYDMTPAGQARLIPVSEPVTNWGLRLFSPCSDLYLLIPQAAGAAIKGWELPSGNLWQPEAMGFSRSPVTTVLGNTVTARVTGQGSNGLTLTGVNPGVLDNPGCVVTPAPQVDLFLSPVSTAPTRTNSTRRTAFFSVGANASVNVNVGPHQFAFVGSDPNNPNRDHRCFVAEAWDPAGDPLTPAPPPPSFDIVARRQAAQKNMVILRPNSPRFVATFRAENATDKDQDAVVTMAPISQKGPALKGDPLLSSLPSRAVRIERYGVAPYYCGQEAKAVPKPRESVKIRIPARGAVTLLLVADAAEEPNPKRPAAALFNVFQEMGGVVVGGITYVFYTGDKPLRGVTLPDPDVGYPIGLVGTPFAAPAAGMADDPFAALSAGAMQAGVCAYFANQSRRAVRDVRIVLEGMDDAAIVPGGRVFRVDSIKPKEQFRAVWPVNLRDAWPGTSTARFVLSDPANGEGRLFGLVTVR